jgi:hypothetical protein
MIFFNQLLNVAQLVNYYLLALGFALAFGSASGIGCDFSLLLLGTPSGSAPSLCVPCLLVALFH